MRIKTTHTATRTGKRVRVEVVGGKVIIGKYFDRDSNSIYIDTNEGRIRIRRGTILRFGDFRKQQNT